MLIAPDLRKKDPDKLRGQERISIKFPVSSLRYQKVCRDPFLHPQDRSLRVNVLDCMSFFV
ncbi:hypothetical protein DLM78_20750 [Leptospira stimsonii]|uniref:Uncharacterized protein n=1 Tax=Leptospira stimsonii TaxID=2202203 RepID=A0A8B3CLH5_9LEPT|nr:hypothetical protein DLM78_20750 [Leptospira stimsonii]